MTSCGLVLTFVVLTVVTFSSTQNHGDTCGPDRPCKTDVGLICNGDKEGKCACGNGRFEQNLTSVLDYKMEWSTTKSRCLGVEGSLCVGTRRHPNPNGQKGVSCEDNLTCVQIPALPNGVGICKAIPSTSSHGTECDQNNYCEASYGLICGDNGTCECAGGALNDEIKFDLTWDNERYCVASVNTPCVGTQLNPLPIGAEKRVECERGTCTQLKGQPPGIGICKSLEEPGDGSSTNPPSSTTPKEESTTAGNESIYTTKLSSLMILLFLIRLA